MHGLKCVLVLADINIREGFQGYSISYYSMSVYSVTESITCELNIRKVETVHCYMPKYENHLDLHSKL